ncbi:hypothetical protein AGENTSMITH_148 [Bacillus phage vB_BspM_AgentSmith]|nr:hypothetical protein AGENTSMITH_148 [Bacillus phage vB_BspM_AgentSmith]
MLDNLDTLEIVDDELVKKTKPKKDYTKYYYWLFALFILTSIFGVLAKEAKDSFVSKTVVDVRPCEYNVKGVEVKGKRYYTYKYNEVFGIRFIDTSKIGERTDILHEFKGTTIIGMNDSEWWSLNLGKGEPTIKTLGKAESYTFVQDGLAGVVSYDNFCK